MTSITLFLIGVGSTRPSGQEIGVSNHWECLLANGLTLLVEPVEDVRSASLTLLVPAGTAREEPDQGGLANLVVSMVTRGAGPYSNRELVNIQDQLGLQRSESAETIHASFTVATLADRLEEALELTAHIVRRPHLPADELEMCQSGILQEIQAIEDDPAQKLLLALRERVMPSPLSRPILGTVASVQATTVADIREFHRRYYGPNDAILGIAGNVEFRAVQEMVDRYFGDWINPQLPSPPMHLEGRPVIREHLSSDTIQSHLGIAWQSVPYGDADYFNANGAVSVLSGGMSSRLWTEVREKRGLCYSVSASYLPFKEIGVVFAHAATTSSERADETLEVIREEVRRLSEGITEDEVARVRAGLKTSLVMQQESTAARASVLARSWYYLGRVRTVEEIAAEIDKLTPKTILEYLERCPLKEIGIVTLGPQPVEIPHEV